MDISFDTSAFQSLSVNIGSFNASGSSTSEFESKPQINLTIGSTNLALAITGKLKLRCRLYGGIATTHVSTFFGDYDLPDLTKPPYAGVDFDAEMTFDSPVGGLAQSLVLNENLGDPADVIAALSSLEELLTSGYRSGAKEALQTLVNAVPWSDFPFYDKLDRDTKDKISSLITDGLGNQLDWLAQKISNALHTALDGLRQAVIDVAQNVLQAVGERAKFVCELLIAMGLSWRDVLLVLARRLVDLGRSLVDDMVWLFDWIYGLNPQDAIQLVVRTIKQGRDAWDDTKDHVRALLKRINQLEGAIGGSGIEEAAKVYHLLLADADMAGSQLANYLQIFVDLIGMFFQAIAADWKKLTGFIAELVAAVRQAAQGLGDLLQRLYAMVRSIHLMNREEFIDHLKQMQDDIMKQTCIWMSHNWDKVKIALREAVEELKLAVDFVAQLAAHAGAAFDKEMSALHASLDWLVRQPGDSLRAITEANLLTFAHNVHQIYLKGLSGIRDMAVEANKGMTTLVRDAIELNDLRKLFDKQAVAFIEFVCHSAELAVSQLPGAPTPADQEKAAKDALNFAKSVPTEVHDAYVKTMAVVMKAEAAVETFLNMIDDILFAGDHGPPAGTLEVLYHRIQPGDLQIPGAVVERGPSLLQLALQDVQDFTGVLLTATGTELGVLELRGKAGRFAMPAPGVPSQGDTYSSGEWTTLFQLPATVPAALRWLDPSFEPSFAIGHLPDVYVLDMRYQMPYGKLAQYKVADLDGDGFVMPREVETVRRAAGAGSKEAAMDCDGDGLVTANDVQLAIEQQTLYLNGLMYRRVATPIGFFWKLDDYNWAYDAICSCKDESIPGKVERRGVIFVREGQLSIPGLDYPLRFHLELRFFLDRFPELEPLGIFTPMINPAMRTDVVVYCGPTGRDLQLAVSFTPPNIYARTWVVRGTCYIRGTLTGGYAGVVAWTGAGVAAKGDVRIQVVYECGSPLVVVIKQWHDRLKAAHKEIWQFIGDPPGFITGLFSEFLEDTEIAPLFRSLVRAFGPYMDVLFGWTDPQHHLRGVMAHIHEYLLPGRSPAWTWKALRTEVANWPAAHVATDLRDRVVAVLDRTRAELPASEDDFVLMARLLLYRVIEDLRPLGSFDTVQSMPPEVKKVLGVCHLLFIDGMSRFSPSYAELVQDHAAATVHVPLLGDVTNRPDIGVFSAAKVVAPTDPMPSDTVIVKPIYRSSVQFGPGAILSIAPSRLAPLVLKPLKEHSLGVVLSSTVLEHEGDYWVFVRTDDNELGWVAGGPLDDAILSTKTIDGASRTAIDPLHMREMQQPRPIVRLAPSPAHTVDSTDKTQRIRALLGGAVAIHDPVLDTLTDPEAIEVRDLYRMCVDFMAWRTFNDAGHSVGTAGLSGTYKKLKNTEQSAWWAQEQAEIKSIFYLVKISQELGSKVLPPFIEADYATAWNALTEILGKIASFSPDEAAIASDDAVPAIIEAIGHLWHIGQKLFEIASEVGSATKDAVETVGEWNAAHASSESLAAKKKNEENFKEIESTKGNDPETNQKLFDARWDRWKHKAKEEGLTMRDLRYGVLLAAQKMRLMLPYRVELELLTDADWTNAEVLSNKEQAYRQSVGIPDPEGQKSIYEQTKDMTTDQREAFLKKEAYAEAFGNDPDNPIYKATKDMCEEEQAGYLTAVAEAQSAGTDTPDGTVTEYGWSKWKGADLGITKGTVAAGELHAVDGDNKLDVTVEGGHYGTDGLRAGGVTLGGSTEGDDSQATFEAKYQALSADTSQITLGAFGIEGQGGVGDGQSKEEIEAKEKADKEEKERQHSFSLKFGDDTITITWSIEGGGGGGEGDEAGGGEVVDATGGFKMYGYMCKIPIKEMFASKQSLGILFRFFIRYGIHFADAADLWIDWWNNHRTEERNFANDFAPIAFSCFAIIDAMRDIVNDHPEWVARMLESVKGSLQVEVNGSVVGALGIASADLNETVTLKATMSLGTLLGPLIQILEGGAIRDQAITSAADRMVPAIDVEVEDRTCVKVGVFPAAIEIESTGSLGKAKLSIPQGSSLREKMREVADKIAEMADHYKQSRLDAAGQTTEPGWLGKVRGILAQLDRAALGLTTTGEGGDLPFNNPDTAYWVDLLRGQPAESAPAAPPVAAQVQAAKDAITRTGIRGLEMEAGQVLVAEPAGTLLKISIYVNDDEKEKLDRLPFNPPTPAETSLEDTTWKIPLPQRPLELCWNLFHDPLEDEGKDTTGIIAGFDTKAQAEQFRNGINTAWVGDFASVESWPRSGRFWCWLDTTLLDKLSDKNCPLPALSTTSDGAMIMDFKAAPPDGVKTCGAPIIAAARRSAQRTVWHYPLVTEGTHGDFELLYRTLMLNRRDG